MMEAAIREALTRLSSQVSFVVHDGGHRNRAPRCHSRGHSRRVRTAAGRRRRRRMRSEGSKSTKFAALSRAVCGVRGRSVILNLPGKPSGAVESLQAVVDLVPHALQLLTGNTRHD